MTMMTVSTTPIKIMEKKAHEEVQEKEKSQSQHKKRKADKLANTVNLAEEDISFIFEAIVEVVKSSIKGIGKKQL